jgi:hypothetical protein
LEYQQGKYNRVRIQKHHLLPKLFRTLLPFLSFPHISSLESGFLIQSLETQIEKIPLEIIFVSSRRYPDTEKFFFFFGFLEGLISGHRSKSSTLICIGLTMGKGLTTLLLSCVLFSLCASSFAQTCKSYTFSSNKVFNLCQDLPVLSAFLHWSYDQSTNKVDIAYRHTGTSTSRWVAWAINPTSTKMEGAQALVAYQNSSSVMHAYTSPVSSYATTLAEGALSFAVSNLSATFENSNEITIFATLTLGSGMTTVNQVWQEGPLNGGSPGIHDTSASSANMKSMATLNFLDDQATTSAGGGITSRQRRQNVSNSISKAICCLIFEA